MSRHERPLRPVLGAAAVVIHDGCVLLIRRGQPPDAGAWSIPGGAVELGEPVEDALRREVREETGIEIAVGEFLEVFERVEHDAAGAVQFHFVVLDYAATVTGGVLRSGDDAADAAFAPLDDLDRYALADSIRRVISSARRSRPAGPGAR
jgi:ADP-ribose pyrophosphatase YjhB (NUDIX family)